ncbi:hypothetical protein KXV95_001964 [Aspergillus fumigatus]|nr:hypothetical protein KXX11_009688 [Aspergillus fumigatus]KMK61685.1 hypothetical protein Y699_02526 [Aspergillus fumigatus Z5]KAH1418113.1 hypothetical protein KXX22_005149 [Aspergillus fumigatus]KAH1602986.1 hypothetical protein KXX34_008907 [Aspergillus fumigatus]KAH1668764.1 hypothetical protein KXX15_006801 [Aspergillus fumigatus]
MRETRSFEIPLCHELGSFIKYADGVQDPDFRRSGIARFRPGFVSEPADYALKDHPTVLSLPPPDINGARESLKAYLQYILCDENIVDVSGRSMKTWKAHLYSRRLVEDSNPSQKDWVWCVVVFHADGENPLSETGGPQDPIPFLSFWNSIALS